MINETLKQILNHIASDCISVKDQSDNIAFRLGQQYFNLYNNPVDVNFNEVEELMKLMPDALHSFTGGDVAVLFFLAKMHKKNMIETEQFSEMKLDTKEFCQELLDFYKENKEYDLFVGLIGLGLYFIESGQYELVDETIKSIDSIKISIQNGRYYWLDPFKKGFINLGLAHGLPSIVSFLVECAKKGRKKELCSDLILGAMSYMESIFYKNQSQKFVFPSYINNNSGEESFSNRLAWCYGDLGAAICFWKAGILLEKDKWLEIALDLLKKSADINISDSGVFYNKKDEVYDTGLF